jgi:ketosteroid isomerase-like protein
MDLEAAVGQCRLAWNDFVTGNPGPVKSLFSHGDDVTLANPWDPPWLGWAQVSQALESGAARFSDGERLAVDEVARYVTPNLACFLETERWLARVDGGADVVPFALRVTSVYRREGVTWKIVHRHADATTTPQPSGAALGLGPQQS